MDVATSDKAEPKMKKQYIGDKFQILSLRIKNDPIEIPIYEICFPEALLRGIQKLDANKRISNLRLNELKMMLYNFFPEIIYIQPIQPKDIGKPWIISASPIDLSEIEFLLGIWLKAYYSQLQDVNWKGIEQYSQSLQIDFTMLPNGTPEIRCYGGKSKYYEGYPLLVHYLHSILPRFDMTIENKAFIQRLSFSRSFDGEYPEWISTSAYGSSPWSIRIKMTLQTIPMDSSFYAYFHVETIRWSPSVYTRNPRTKLHMYLRFPNQLRRESQDCSFIKMDFNKMYWSPFLMEILNSYGYGDLLPDVTTFKNDPLSFIRESEGFTIGIPFGPHIKAKHYAASGASPIDRFQISNNIRKQLVASWGGFDPNFVLLKQDTSRVNAYKLKEWMFPESFAVEIYYQNESLRDATIQRVIENMDLVYDEEMKNYRIRQTEKRVELKDFSIQKIWKKDAFHITKKEEIKEQIDVVNAFRQKIAEKLKSVDKPTFCIIELHGKEKFEGTDEVDPKSVIRTAFALKDRLTQFIVPLEEDDGTSSQEHRLQRAILDLMRQMGVIKKNIHKMLKVPTAHIGIFLKTFKGTSTIIPVLVSAFHNQIYMYISGVTKKWVSYPEGQLLLGKLSVESYKLFEDIGSSLFQAIKMFEFQFKPKHVTLYLLAQNARDNKRWAWLQNRNLHCRGIEFKEGDPIQEDHWTLVRLRNEIKYEAPEWVFFGKEKSDLDDVPPYAIPEALKSGVLRWNEILAFSVAPKPFVMQDMPYYASRFEWDQHPFRKETALEMCIPWCAKNVERDRIFNVTHRLRDVSIQFDEFTALPLPLHLARKAMEYVIKMDNLLS